MNKQTKCKLNPKFEFIFLLIIVILISCNRNSISKDTNNLISKQNNSLSNLSCKLDSAGLQLRKQTLLKEISQKVLEKKQVKNGYAYRFDGNDKIIHLLSEFVIAERSCCDFFDFTLKISDQNSSIWMEVSGPKGTKEFIDNILEF